MIIQKWKEYIFYVLQKKNKHFLTVTLKTKYLIQKISHNKLIDIEIFKIINNKPEPLKFND